MAQYATLVLSPKEFSNISSRASMKKVEYRPKTSNCDAMFHQGLSIVGTGYMEKTEILRFFHIDIVGPFPSIASPNSHPYNYRHGILACQKHGQFVVHRQKDVNEILSSNGSIDSVCKVIGSILIVAWVDVTFHIIVPYRRPMLLWTITLRAFAESKLKIGIRQTNLVYGTEFNVPGDFFSEPSTNFGEIEFC
ncbi:hypothetical protein RF11_05665 [Thelohanellus kitauei]|uniref:Uncharacterized protein n=1 Tax=Thelohanellus kitauei TaxID=669202 RepID=A0A0C2J926_THEKT|nr:hypothetical protein RF11_05665 [Thelohanellus kitauei]